jgi:hypothetical protein
MSNRAVVLQTWVANNPDAGLALVTKPVPEAKPGQVVVHIILRPVNPADLVPFRTEGFAYAKDGSFTLGSEGVGIVHDVRIFFMRFLPSIWLHLKFLDYYDKPRITVMIDCSIELILLLSSVCAYKLFLKMPAGRRGSDDSSERPKSGAIRTS